MKYLLTILTLLFSTYATAGPYIALNTQSVDYSSSYDVIPKTDTLYGLTFGGVNADPSKSNFKNSAWELSADFGANTINKVSGENYNKHSLYNISMNIVLKENIYAKVGAGFLWRHSVFSDGHTDEHERLVNYRFGLGTRMFDNLLVAGFYDKATEGISIQIGFSID